jgi:hypothetical protein
MMPSTKKQKTSRGDPPQISSFSRVQNAIGSRYELKPNADGRRNVSIGGLGAHPVTLFTQVYHNDPELQKWKPGMTCDHIDQDKSNDHKSNLRWANNEEQRRNQTQTAESMQNQARTHGHAVEGQMRNDDGTWTEWRRFHSKAEAARAASTSDTAVINSIKYDRTVTIMEGEWRFRMLQRTDANGDIWMHHPHVDGMEIDLARGVFKRDGGGETKGYKHGVYRKLTIGDHQRNVHDVFGTLLHGERPSNLHTMEHESKELDEDGCLSNSASNLVGWFDKKEQASTASHGSGAKTQCRSIWARRHSDGELLGPYADSEEAAGPLGLGPRFIREACDRNSTKKAKNYDIWAEPQPDLVRARTSVGLDGRVSLSLEKEVWAVVHVSDWKPGGKYYKILKDFKATGKGKRLPPIGPIGAISAAS